MLTHRRHWTIVAAIHSSRWQGGIIFPFFRARSPDGKTVANAVPYLLKPHLPLVVGTCHHNGEYPAKEVRHAAQAEDAVFPKRFKRVAEDVLFSLDSGIRSVEPGFCNWGFGMHLSGSPLQPEPYSVLICATTSDAGTTKEDHRSPKRRNSAHKPKERRIEDERLPSIFGLPSMMSNLSEA